MSCGQGLGRTRAGAKTPKFRSRTLNASFSDCKTVLVRLVLCPRGKAVSKVAEAGDFRLLSASLYPQSPLTMCITKPPPTPSNTLSSHSPDPSKIPHLCFCRQAWHRGSPALALQPRLRLPIGSSQCHVLHLDIHSLEDSKPLGYTSQSRLAPLLPISPALTPDPHLPPPIAPSASSTRSPSPTSQSSPTFTHSRLTQPFPGGLTSFPGCPTGISAEWPRSRGALAS